MLKRYHGVHPLTFDVKGIYEIVSITFSYVLIIDTILRNYLKEKLQLIIKTFKYIIYFIRSC